MGDGKQEEGERVEEVDILYRIILHNLYKDGGVDGCGSGGKTGMNRVKRREICGER